LEEELSEMSRNHEEEVYTRLRFEAKLNNLYAQHRELESKFNILTKELQIHSERNAENQTLIVKLKNENYYYCMKKWN